MESISLPSQTNTQSLTGAAAPRTDTQQAEIQMQRIADTKEAQQDKLDTRDQEEARFNAVKKAAQRIASTNPLSPSIARFTIYRDTLSEGITFITRFTNIYDGKVTTIREPQILAEFAKEQGTILDGVV